MARRTTHVQLLTHVSRAAGTNPSVKTTMPTGAHLRILVPRTAGAGTLDVDVQGSNDDVEYARIANQTAIAINIGWSTFIDAPPPFIRVDSTITGGASTHSVDAIIETQL